jgi:hypothetical protein
MIERVGFGDFASFDIQCDYCEFCENFDTDGDFSQAISDAKEHGWKVIKNGSGWLHKCASCVENIL